MVRIKRAAIHRGYTKFTHVGWAAAGYIILVVFSNAANRTNTDTVDQVFAYAVTVLLASCGIAAIMAVVQRAANASNLAKLGKDYTFRAAYAGEVVMIIVGVIISIAAVGLSLYSTSSVEADEISPYQQSMYDRIESLRSQYDTCSGDLSLRQNGVDTSSAYEVEAYNNDWQLCENTRLELNALVDTYNSALED
jgi:uncharacterized membrane protein